MDVRKNVKKNLKAQVYFDDSASINLFLPAKTYYCQSGFYHRKTGFSSFWQKPANSE